MSSVGEENADINDGEYDEEASTTPEVPEASLAPTVNKKNKEGK